MGIISFTIVFLGIVLNIRSVYHGFRSLMGVLSPFIIGTVLALFLDVPMKFLEKRLFANKKFEKTRRTLSIFLTLLFVFGIICTVMALVVPQLTKTIYSIIQSIPGVLHDLNVYQKEMVERMPQFADAIQELNLSGERILNGLMDFLNRWVSRSGSEAMAKLGGTFGSLFNICVGVVFAIYILMQKEKLKEQLSHFLHAYLKPAIADHIWEVGKLSRTIFQKFISGQCLEACILGMMFFISMSLFRMPYAMLISVLIAVTALIPVWGAFIGCVVGCILIAVINPMQAIGFLVLFFVLQQIEGNLIYPHVVGSSIGLPSIWVLVAVTVGGKLYGIVGMIFFIPLCSILYTLLREDVRSRLRASRRPC